MLTLFSTNMHHLPTHPPDHKSSEHGYLPQLQLKLYIGQRYLYVDLANLSHLDLNGDLNFSLLIYLLICWSNCQSVAVLIYHSSFDLLILIFFCLWSVIQWYVALNLHPFILLCYFDPFFICWSNCWNCYLALDLCSFWKNFSSTNPTFYLLIHWSNFSYVKLILSFH